MKKLIAVLWGIVLIFGLAGTARAALWDRGGGLIYDDVLNITWLQDANLAATETFGVSGIDPYGYMTWPTVQAWINAMNATEYKGISEWRLPRTLPVNGTCYNYIESYNGSSDYGYNISAPDSAYPESKFSEMAYMYYNNLGNTGFYDVNGNSPQPGWGLQNTGPFFNVMQILGYWSGTEYGLTPGNIWAFGFDDGDQGGGSMYYNRYAWAVMDGDVAAVPIPSAIFLLGSGLIGLVGFRSLLSRKSDYVC